ncbi:hypothetical protein CRC_01544 [Cylindrospermopsis raciborskii CS-505]|jgi:hypothetical protein|nr:hypothetical protein CRC_01544 [Cylindrospermopsis raciborskii CS-505]
MGLTSKKIITKFGGFKKVRNKWVGGIKYKINVGWVEERNPTNQPDISA